VRTAYVQLLPLQTSDPRTPVVCLLCLLCSLGSLCSLSCCGQLVRSPQHNKPKKPNEHYFPRALCLNNKYNRRISNKKYRMSKCILYHSAVPCSLFNILFSQAFQRLRCLDTMMLPSADHFQPPSNPCIPLGPSNPT